MTKTKVIMPIEEFDRLRELSKLGESYNIMYSKLQEFALNRNIDYHDYTPYQIVFDVLDWVEKLEGK